MELPPVCILAGGLGSRLGAVVRDTPKPLVEVAGEPFLFHQLRLLAAAGVSNVVLCVGYLGQLIEKAIGNRCFSIDIAYSYDGPGLDGTLGALRRAAPLLGERFLVLYGDTYLRIDYRRFAEEWAASGLPAAMAVLHNRGRWERSNVVFKTPRVEVYDKWSPPLQAEWIDFGLGALSRQSLDLFRNEESDLAALYRHLAAEELLFGYEATQRFYEIGTPEALQETDLFLRSERSEKDP